VDEEQPVLIGPFAHCNAQAAGWIFSHSNHHNAANCYRENGAQLYLSDLLSEKFNRQTEPDCKKKQTIQACYEILCQDFKQTLKG